ncbi:hypothetical protein ACOMHN_001819 [Nucella lapillus]
MTPSGFVLKSYPRASKGECLSLSSWGLPGPVLEAYHSQGITTMFHWQAECLMTGNVLNGGNLVYSAPTSAGKTMVAELLILKRVLETRCKALFILPFVSVTREKMVSLQRLFQDAGVRVGGFMGRHSPVGGLHSVDVAVCTIEKGNSLVNRLMEEGNMDTLGVVVIDELHMVGDSNRGYLLELLLTKVCYMSRKSRQSSSDHGGVQVIGMSATLPNLDLLGLWLDANLYHSDFRPVPLTQHIKVGTTIYDETMTRVRDLEVKHAFQGDEDHIIPLCLETIMGGHSILIFCPTKAWCEKMSEKIAREFYGLLKNPAGLAAYTGETGFVKASEMARLPIDQASLRNVLEQLGRSPVGVDPMLGKVLHYAVAYHHAGLTFDERDIVEGAFRQGLVKVLVATSTLSSGVNLPARRVIVRSPQFGARLMDALAYKQMAGRAGRKGVDTQGECVLVCKEGEKRMAQGLLRSDLPPVTSCLHNAADGAHLSRSMKRAILEVVVSGVASTPADVARYVACTLLSASLPLRDDDNNNSTAQLITACLAFLEDNEFVTLHAAKDSEGGEVTQYQPTQLGSAVLASSMSPDEGLDVFAELQKARQCFVLANELHIIYLVTPIYSQEISRQLEWYHFYCLWDKLSPEMRLVAKTVGVEEAFLAKAISGRVPSKTAAQARAVAIHRRFYTALALHDLVQEVPLLEVAAKYSCNKGQLQSLMQSAATFAGMVTVFCARLGWSNMELLFAQFQQRLTLGVTRELCDLVRIPLLTATLARVLFNAGYQTVASAAHAAPEEVETIFRKASPFQSNKKQDGESDWEVEQRRKARCMWLSGRKGVTELEAATAIIEEAKTLIQQELGVCIIHWGQGSPTDTDGRDDEMSASRTVLDSVTDGSVLVEETPENGSRNSSSRQSPVVAGEGGNGISPECGPSRLKRKSPGAGGGGYQTHVANPQARRSLSCRSVLKRRSSGKQGSSRKSPLSNSQGLQGRTQSPKDVSFFGQVVVSPPPSMKSQRKITPGKERGEHADRKSHHGLSPTLDAAVPSKRFANSRDQDAHCSDKMNCSSPQERVLCTLDDCEATESERKTTVGKSNKVSDEFIDVQQLLHPSEPPQEIHSEQNEPKMDQDREASSLQAGVHGETAQTLPPENNVSCAGITQQGKAAHSASEQSSENQTDVSQDRDHDDNCFDDSLILNTQTDNLLSGHVSQLHSALEKSCEKLTASTPLASAQVCRKTLKDTENSQQSSSDEKPSMGLSSHDVAQDRLRDTEVVNPSSTKQTSDPVRDEESFTDDMFTSPFASSPSGSNQLHSSSKSTRKESEAVTAEENDNRRDDWQVEDDVMDCGSEAEESAELIAASNYDRVAYMEEGLIETSADGSYQDLASSVKVHDSGQLIYADLDPEERAEEQGDSPTAEDKHTREDYNIQEDLAIAANMSDSFSSTVMEGGQKFSAVVPAAAPQKSPQLDSDNVDAFSTSFTMSMMEKAFADESFSAMASETVTLKERASQKHLARQEGNSIEAEPDSRAKAGVKRSPADNCNSDITTKKEPFSVEETVTDKNRYKQSSNSQRAKNPSAASTPRSSEEFVPPTPPDDSSSAVSSPRVSVRRTPIRACRTRGDSNQQRAHTSADTHLETGRRKAKDKENMQTTQGVQSTQKNKEITRKVQSTKERSHKSQTVPERSSQTSSKERTGKSQTGTSQTSTKERSHKSQTAAQSSTDQTTEVNNPLGKHAASVSSTAHTDVLETGQREAVVSSSENNQLRCASADLAYLDSPPPSQESLCVIDVCSSAQLFAMFTAEWRSKQQYAISLACEKKASPVQIGGGIGSHFVQGRGASREAGQCSRPQGVVIPGDGDMVIVGLAVAWAESEEELDDTLAAPPGTQSVSQEQRRQMVKEILQQTQDRRSSHAVVAFDAKSTYTLLARGLGVAFGRCRDPQIACWLLDPGAREKTLHSMVTNYLPSDLPLLEGIGGSVGYGSLGLTVQSTASGRMRAVMESIVARRLMDCFWNQLTEVGLAEAFTNTEMPSVLTLARMELNGFGFSNEECESQKNLMLAKLSALEHEAYTLAGHPFSLTSTEDIAQVLYLELHLPVNGDPSATKPVRTLGPSRRRQAPHELHLPVNGDPSATKPVRTLGPSRRRQAPRGRQKSAFSTSKDILEKLKPFHPLPALILEWRRISNALTKHVYPLQKEKVYSDRLGMFRIYSESQLHTATGRVSMMEPNLQNVPKDFDIVMPDSIGESPPTSHSMSHTAHPVCGRGGNSRLQTMRGVTPQVAHVNNPATARHMAVSMRHTFVPFPGGVILAADYSQLELRVIAHLSGDAKLISILNNDGDVFKLIAAQWKNTMPEFVTKEERQHAKQICYGMLYGIGPRALGEQIGVDENDAAVFMESFKAKYTGVRSYLRKTVEECREKGYVTTVAGRRRYLPAIKDTNPLARAQAERQAVNSTVQGSAADMVKTAMNVIDQELAGVFPHTQLPHRHRHAEAERPRGAFLTLQLHDELIYEVSQGDLPQVASIIKHGMETSTTLSVPLPVKVKVGPSWGHLQDLEL